MKSEISEPAGTGRGHNNPRVVTQQVGGALIDGHPMFPRGARLLTRGVLHQEAGGVAPLHLAALQQVHGQELALGGVDLEVARGQREDEHGGDEHQEQGQAAGGGRR